MSVQFTFKRCDASKVAANRAFMDAILATRRFSRNAKSQILFTIAPGDHVMVDRRQGFQSIVEETGVLELSGDIDDSAWMAMWMWLTAAKWKLPRTDLVLR